MIKIALFLGGDSSEREVSLVSGKAIAEELTRLGYPVLELDPGAYSKVSGLLEVLEKERIDLVFNALHGGSGENGELQAALSLSGIKYTGSDFRACCFAMDKYVSKLIAAAEGIPVPAYILLREDLLHDYNDPEDYQGFIDKLGLPLIVKPNDGGSSVGITKVMDIMELKPAVELAFKHSDSVLAEQFIPGRELTVTVLDGEALPLVEIKPVNGWYDYENKYTKGHTEYISPAQIEDEAAKLMQIYALRVWKAFSCKGYARVDFRYDAEKAYFLELNTLPGMTSLSLTPMAAKAAGMEFGQLLEQIIKSSVKNMEEQ